MLKPTGQSCKKHGGNCDQNDAFWLCDQCARSGIDLCSCGSHARYFGEALMCSVCCESCSQYVMNVSEDGGIIVRKAWNEGLRGSV